MNKPEKKEKKGKEGKQKDIDTALQNSEGSKSDDHKKHREILSDQISEGLEVFDRNNSSIFLNSLAAGLEIGFSFLLLCISFSFFSGKFPEETVFKLMAFVYPVGFIFVILGKSILFTEQTSLLALTVLNNQRLLGGLMKVWGLVIAGNVIGGYIIAMVLIWLGPKLGIFELDAPKSLGEHITGLEPHIILVSAILAGWLMALLSWLLSSSKDTTSRLLIIYLVTWVLSFADLQHSIVGNMEAFAGFLISPNVSFGDYLTFMAAALLGNSLGGVFFVALLKYNTFTRNVE